ncbi:MAG: nucleotidyl transferase AbiEii/AbiGii toxin family protein [Candidatus Roizmanbacteria bacterium]
MFDINKSLLPAQQETFVLLKPFFHEFYLSGGTGLSFHLQHRISFDFDLFTDHLLPRFFTRKVTQVLPIKQMIVDTDSEVTFLDERGVKITFLYFPYPRIGKLINIHGALVDSLDDIVANKLHVIGRRSQIRDYVDIYTLITGTDYTIQKCIALAKQKYGNEFDPQLAIGQLCYIDDLDFNDGAFTALGVLKEDFVSRLAQTAREIV